MIPTDAAAIARAFTFAADVVIWWLVDGSSTYGRRKRSRLVPAFPPKRSSRVRPLFPPGRYQGGEDLTVRLMVVEAVAVLGGWRTVRMLVRGKATAEKRRIFERGIRLREEFDDAAILR